jgi:hypothetical protein
MRILFWILALVPVFMVCAWGQAAVDRSAILETPEWQSIYDSYTPDEGLLVRLREKARDLAVDVYLGFWCSDSRNNVPVFLKILDVAAISGIDVHFYSVERKKNPEVRFFVEDREVERVPTFIFMVNGVERGRIVENPISTILEDIVDILR